MDILHERCQEQRNLKNPEGETHSVLEPWSWSGSGSEVDPPLCGPSTPYGRNGMTDLGTPKRLGSMVSVVGSHSTFIIARTSYLPQPEDMAAHVLHQSPTCLRGCLPGPSSAPARAPLPSPCPRWVAPALISGTRPSPSPPSGDWPIRAPLF